MSRGFCDRKKANDFAFVRTRKSQRSASFSDAKEEKASTARRGRRIFPSGKISVTEVLFGPQTTPTMSRGFCDRKKANDFAFVRTRKSQRSASFSDAKEEKASTARRGRRIFPSGKISVTEVLFGPQTTPSFLGFYFY